MTNEDVSCLCCGHMVYCYCITLKSEKIKSSVQTLMKEWRKNQRKDVFSLSFQTLQAPRTLSSIFLK